MLSLPDRGLYQLGGDTYITATGTGCPRSIHRSLGGLTLPTGLSLDAVCAIMHVTRRRESATEELLDPAASYRPAQEHRSSSARGEQEYWQCRQMGPYRLTS